MECINTLGHKYYGNKIKKETLDGTFNNCIENGSNPEYIVFRAKDEEVGRIYIKNGRIGFKGDLSVSGELFIAFFLQHFGPGLNIGNEKVPLIRKRDVFNINYNTYTYITDHFCPSCKNTLFKEQKYCHNCGQVLLWK